MEATTEMETRGRCEGCGAEDVLLAHHEGTGKNLCVSCFEAASRAPEEGERAVAAEAAATQEGCMTICIPVRRLRPPRIPPDARVEVEFRPDNMLSDGRSPNLNPQPVIVVRVLHSSFPKEEEGREFFLL